MVFGVSSRVLGGSRALWSLLDGIWGVLKGTWGVKGLMVSIRWHLGCLKGYLGGQGPYGLY